MPGLTQYEIIGDACEPDLRSGDFLVTAPATGFLYDGDYLLDFGDGPTPYRATKKRARVEIGRPNPRYGRFELTRDDFDAAVIGVVVGDARIRSRSLIHQAHQRRQQVFA